MSNYTKREMEFANELSKYEGQWVAVQKQGRSEKIVGHGKRIADAVKDAEVNGYDHATHLKVPRSDRTYIMTPFFSMNLYDTWTPEFFIPYAMLGEGLESTAKKIGVAKSTLSKHIREDGLRVYWDFGRGLELKDTVLLALLQEIRRAEYDTPRRHKLIEIIDNLGL